MVRHAGGRVAAPSALGRGPRQALDNLPGRGDVALHPQLLGLEAHREADELREVKDRKPPFDIAAGLVTYESSWADPFGAPLTNDSYVSMPYGPVLSATLDRINETFDLMHAGKSIRSVVTF